MFMFKIYLFLILSFTFIIRIFFHNIFFYCKILIKLHKLNKLKNFLKLYKINILQFHSCEQLLSLFCEHQVVIKEWIVLDQIVSKLDLQPFTLFLYKSQREQSKFQRRVQDFFYQGQIKKKFQGAE